MNYLSVFRYPSFSGFNLKKEYLNLVFWLLVFLVAPKLLRFFDSTAAPLDAGVLSAILVAILAVLLFQAVTWWVIRIIWPAFADYSNHYFAQNFKQLLPWQKLLIYLSFYLLLLFAFVCSFSALF